MRSITIDILNDRVLNLLKELQELKLIRLRSDRPKEKPRTDWTIYKGRMAKQPLNEVDLQLSELRSDWE